MEAVAVGVVDLSGDQFRKIVVERYGHFHHGKSAAHVAVTDVLRGDDDVARSCSALASRRARRSFALLMLEVPPFWILNRGWRLAIPKG